MNIGHNSNSQDIDSLPLGLYDIGETFGYEMAEALVTHFGGLELRIPHKLKDGHQLLALGPERAQELCDFCPGDTILVPKSLDYTKDRKDCEKKVLSLKEKGLTNPQIARVLNITQRHARRLANKKSLVDRRQLDMFAEFGDD